MDRPIVSIITPTYNSERFIEQTINSILNQTFTNWELLIVDDCSTDNTWEIISQAAKEDSRIKPLRLDKNSGSGVARNLAIQKAGGKYLAFIDSDDLWLPQKLDRHIDFMLKGNHVFSHTPFGYVSEDGRQLKKIHKVRSKPVDYKYLLKRTDIGCLTAIYDQEQIGKFYMPDLRRKQDYCLWLSILKSGFVSTPYNEVLSYYRKRRNSATSKKLLLIPEHFRLLLYHEKLSFLQSLKFTLYWMVGGVIKKI